MVVEKFSSANLIILILGCILSTISGEHNQGCIATGWTSCCETDSCQVPKSLGSCFCDVSCYDTRDCCQDIESICSPLAGSGVAAGSGFGKDSSTDITTQAPGTEGDDRIPTITSISSDYLLINPAVNNSRLFIRVSIDFGSPPGLLMWRHNGSVVSSRTNPRVTILAGGGLTVRNIKFSDSGMYTVSVSNRQGESIENFKILFQFPTEVMFECTSYTVAEGGAELEVCVKAAFNSRSTKEINVTVQSLHVVQTRGATAGADFNVPLRSMNLSQSLPRACLTVQIVDDAVIEEAEEFVLILTADNALSIVAHPNSTNIVILDNDDGLVFEEPVYEVSEAAATRGFHLALQACVIRNNSQEAASGRENQTTDMTMFTVNGTAKGGVDFMKISVTFTFRFNERNFRMCHWIRIIPDNLTEGEEFFKISIARVDQNITSISTRVKIVDDDFASANLERLLYILAEGSTPLNVCVVLEGHLARSVVLYLNTEGYTATDGEDYRLMSYLIEFMPGTAFVQRQCIAVNITDDVFIEGREQFSIQLSEGPQSPQGMVRIVRNKEATVTIIDNEVSDGFFVNNTPAVYGRDVHISFVRSGAPFSEIKCILRGPGRVQLTTANCASGDVVFSGIPFLYQNFSISVEGELSNGNIINLLQRSFRLDFPVCSLHMINEGVTVDAKYVTVEWAGTGPSATNKVSNFTCLRDDNRIKFYCASPLRMTNFTPGPHRLIVEPAPTHGCRRYLASHINFNV